MVRCYIDLCVSEPVLLLLYAHCPDDDPGHLLVPLLQVDGGGGARRELAGGADLGDVQARIPWF